MKKSTFFIVGTICIILIGFTPWFVQYQIDAAAKEQWQKREKLLKLIVQSYYSDFNNAQMSYKIAQNKIALLTDSIKCENADDYSFDMTSNETVNLSLKAYVGDTSAPIQSTDWENIRPASQDAIHQLQGQYPADYVVAFKDKADEGSSNYIFDIHNHCYLVLPEQ